MGGCYPKKGRSPLAEPLASLKAAAPPRKALRVIITSRAQEGVHRDYLEFREVGIVLGSYEDTSKDFTRS